MRIILKIHSLKVELELSILKYSLEKAVREGQPFVSAAMPNTGNGHRLMEWHRGRCRHHKTEWLSSVFRGALPYKDFYDRPLTHRLNSIHRKEQCRNDGPFRSTLLRHTSFLSGLPRFYFFSVTVHRRHRRAGDDLCFHGLSSGGAFSAKRTINKWVSTSCLP